IYPLKNPNSNYCSWNSVPCESHVQLLRLSPISNTIFPSFFFPFSFLFKISLCLLLSSIKFPLPSSHQFTISVLLNSSQFVGSQALYSDGDHELNSAAGTRSRIL
ncbi:hypothetical protein KSS87_014274, partial [Heliosperma pusillum]